ncbi:OmpA family protein [Jejuia spongiicola]|uniref:OmpA family protein n=1 Tax=Jejuia spongiicola TaxID=2942207 RepID=A0ABT0QHH2_9FLAO|nr:OmpA family protein [Jejuia spongiicola]MCL6296445.1 OmpA family protein [Jejuia spongiicola]
MKKYIKHIFTYSILLLACVAFAQKGQVKKADKKFESLAYIDALEIYENVANKGYENEDLYKRLADAYYFNANYVEAVKWYDKLFALNLNTSPEYNFRYGQTLKAIGNYSDADKILTNFYKSQGLNYINSGEYLSTIEKNSNQYVIDTVGFNTKYSDYPAFYTKDKLYVASASTSSKETPWNKEPTSDIFLVNDSELKVVSGEINTKYNEGSVVITKDGNTMYFTRNNYTNNKLGKDANKTIRLKLYKAERIDGKWTNVIELPFNNDDYSVGHPALSIDESKLYFVSDMQSNGNQGGTDIYEVELFDDGGYGTPFNMIGFNTVGNEMFPFIADNGSFFFSSNGHQFNLGGLDIYKSTPDENGVYGKVDNIGKPINSTMDDFAFVINSDSKTGYFSTNRSGTQSDDVYSFKENENYKAPCIVNLNGFVRDKKTGDILENALVSLIDKNNDIVVQEIVPTGKYMFDEMDCDKVKFIRAEKNGYLTGEEFVDTSKEGAISTDILLDPRKIEIAAGTDIGLLLNPIYFDLDKHNIRPDAAVELQKIVEVMQKNPLIKIDVRSHTDSRANDTYNMTLSNRRAKSTIKYLVKNGINPSRLTGKGYGESQLINGCSNGVKCTESIHQENRRSEFIVVK